MFGRISTSAVLFGVVVIVIGGIIAWAFLGDTDLADETPETPAETAEPEEPATE